MPTPSLRIHHTSDTLIYIVLLPILEGDQRLANNTLRVAVLDLFGKEHKRSKLTYQRFKATLVAYSHASTNNV